MPILLVLWGIMLPAIALAAGAGNSGDVLSPTTTLGLGVVVWLLSLAAAWGVMRTQVNQQEDRLREDREKLERADQEAKSDREKLREQLIKIQLETNHNGVEQAIARLSTAMIDAMRGVTKEFKDVVLESNRRHEKHDDRIRLLEREAVIAAGAFNDLGKAAGGIESLESRVRDLELKKNN